MWKTLIQINIFRRKVNEKLGFTEKIDMEIFFANESLGENKLEDDRENIMGKIVVFMNENLSVTWY